MTSFSLPFFGNITQLATESFGDKQYVWMVLRHPDNNSQEQYPISTSILHLTGLLENYDVHKNTTTLSTEVQGSVMQVAVYTEMSAVYIAVDNGKIYTHRRSVQDKNVGIDVQQVFDFGAQYGMQGLVAFTQNTISGQILSTKRMLVVGTRRATVVEIDDTGAVSIVQEITTTEDISSWHAEYFSHKDILAYNFALGTHSGQVLPFFTKKENDRVFVQGNVVDENDHPICVHNGKVTALQYVYDLDQYGNSARYVVSAGIDGHVYQIPLREYLPIPREPQLMHTQPISSFVQGPFLDGDSSQYGKFFARFYSLAKDNRICAWRNAYHNEALSSADISFAPTAGTLVQIDMIHSWGVYSEERFAGQSRDTKCLVVGGGNQMAIIPIVQQSPQDVLLEDLRQNGKLAQKIEGQGRLTKSTDIIAYTFNGGQQYIASMNGIDDDEEKKKIIQNFGYWSVGYALDSLARLLRDNGLSNSLKEEVLKAFENFRHPRKIVILEQLFTNTSLDEYSKKGIYGLLKNENSQSVRPMEMALDLGRNNSNIAKQALRDLATLVLSKSVLRLGALELLKAQLNHTDNDVALLAWKLFAGVPETEGSSVPQVISGVDGILIGIYSQYVDIRQKMVMELQQRKLLHAFETQLVLRSLLENHDVNIRQRALDVALLRASNLTTVLRSHDEYLHKRLVAIEFPPNERAEQEARTFTDAEISKISDLFAKDDHSIQAEQDIMDEMSMSSHVDVAVLVIVAKALLGDDKSQAQARTQLVSLATSDNSVVRRWVLVGLGKFLTYNEVVQAIQTMALSDSDELIRIIAMKLLLKAYDLGLDVVAQEKVIKLCTEMYKSKSANIRRTVVQLLQERMDKRYNEIFPQTKDSAVTTQSLTDTSPSATSSAVSPKTKAKMEELEAEIAKKKDSIKVLQSVDDTDAVAVVEGQIKALYAELQQLGSTVVAPSGVVSSTQNQRFLEMEVDLFKTIFADETTDEQIAVEAYKSIKAKNLCDLRANATHQKTMYLFLSMRRQVIFDRACADLVTYITNDDTRGWAMEVFTKYMHIEPKRGEINRAKIIWDLVAGKADGLSAAQFVYTAGYNNKLPCRYPREYCLHCDISMDAYRRMIRQSGDWVVAFIMQSFASKNKDFVALAYSDDSLNVLDAHGQLSGMIEKLLGSSDYQQKRVAMHWLRTKPQIVNQAIYSKLLTHILHGDTDAYNCQGLFTYIARTNKEPEFFEKVFQGSRDPRIQKDVIQKVVSISEPWAKKIVFDALQRSSLAIDAFSMYYSHLVKEKGVQSTELREFLQDQLHNGSKDNQLSVLGKLQFSVPWMKQLLEKALRHSENDVRLEAYKKLPMNTTDTPTDPWIHDWYQKGLKDNYPPIFDRCFDAIYNTYFTRGYEGVRSYFESVSDVSIQQNIIQKTLQNPNASEWAKELLLHGLEHSSPQVRAMVFASMEGIAKDIDDSVFVNLLEHSNTDVGEFSTKMLSQRGRGDILCDSLHKTLRENPPVHFDWWDWSWWEKRRKAWLDRKINAIIAAGNTHDSGYFADIQYVMDQIGVDYYRSGWRYAVSSYEWKYLRKLCILNMGWTCSSSTVSILNTGGKNESDPELRVAWYVALSRVGHQEQKNAVQWLFDQFTRNNRYVAKEHVLAAIVGLGAVDSGAHQWFLRIMQERSDLCGDMLLLQTLQFSQKGGDVSFMYAGLTCADDDTRVQSARFFEDIFDKHVMFESLISVLDGMDIADMDPYALATEESKGWYHVASYLYNRVISKKGTKTTDTIISRENWENIAKMVAVDDSKLRARAVGFFFDRRNYGMPAEKFIATVQNFANMLSAKTITVSPISYNSVTPSPEMAHSIASGAYMGLLRDAEFPGHLRGKALQYHIDLCNLDKMSAKTVPVLQALVSNANEEIRKKAYLLLIQQQKDYVSAEVPFAQLVEMGIRSQDHVLKQLAISTLWFTDVYTQAEKISRLEDILHNNDTAAAKCAFELLFALTLTFDLPSHTKAKKKCDADLANLPEISQQKRQTIDADMQRERSKFEKALQHTPAYTELQKIRADRAQINMDAEQTKLSQIRQAEAQFEQDKYLAVSLQDKNDAQYTHTNATQEAENDFQSVLKESQRIIANAEKAFDASNAQSEAYKQWKEKQNQLHIAQKQISVEETEDRAKIEQTYRNALSAELSSEDAAMLQVNGERANALLQMALLSFYPKLRKHAIGTSVKTAAQYRYNATNRPSTQFAQIHAMLLSNVLSLIENSVLSSSYAGHRSDMAHALAEEGFSNGYAILLEELNSHLRPEQIKAINSLSKLLPNSLSVYTDASGKPYPRISIILLQRADRDLTGVVARKEIFEGVGLLADDHQTVRDTLFAILQQGPSDADYSFVLDAIIQISGFNSMVLEENNWDAISATEYHQLADKIRGLYGLDWSRVSSADFRKYYSSVYKENLLTRLLRDLYTRADYKNAQKYIGYARYTRGFELLDNPSVHLASIVSDFAKLDAQPDLKAEAICVLTDMLAKASAYRLPETKNRVQTELQCLTKILSGVKLSAVSESHILIAKTLAYHAPTASSKILGCLQSVAEGVAYDISWRVDAITALGHLGDIRSVRSLLAACGYTDLGEAREYTSVEQEKLASISNHDKLQIEIAASEALGSMIYTMQAPTIYQILSNATKSSDANLQKAGMRGLGYFLNSEEFTKPALVCLLEMLQTALRHNQHSKQQEIISVFHNFLVPVEKQEDAHVDLDIVVTPETKEWAKEYIISVLLGYDFVYGGEKQDVVYFDTAPLLYENSDFANAIYALVYTVLHKPNLTEGQNGLEYIARLSGKERETALRAEFVLATHSYQLDKTEWAVEQIAKYASVEKLFSLIQELRDMDESVEDRVTVLQEALWARQEEVVDLTIRHLQAELLFDSVESIRRGDEEFVMMDVIESIFKQMPNIWQEVSASILEIFQQVLSECLFADSKIARGDKEEPLRLSHFWPVVKMLVPVLQTIEWNASQQQTLETNFRNMLAMFAISKEDFMYILMEYSELPTADITYIQGLLHKFPTDIYAKFALLFKEKDMVSTLLSGALISPATVSVLVNDVSATSRKTSTEDLRQLAQDKNTYSVNALMKLANLKDFAGLKEMLENARDKRSHLVASDLVHQLIQAIILVATEEAEEYLRALSKESNVSDDLRIMTSRAAGKCYRRRVPKYLR